MINKSDKLIENMQIVLGTSFAFYLKAHGYHWNIEGPNFSEYHKFFGDIYEEVWEATDAIAEQIRALDEYVPAALGRFFQLSTIADEASIPSSKEMVRKLLDDNDKVIEALTEAFKESEVVKEVGLSNFLQDRIDIHRKHGWMLRATIKD